MSQTMNEDLNVIANSNLEITYLDGDLAIIQQLDDEPNDVGGLTSAQLKAKFDQAGLAIQSYLNNTLIPELLAADATESAREAAEAGRQAAEQARVTAEAARAAAEQERVNTTSGIVAQATQKANEAAASAVRAEQVALGNIPDGSLAKAKLVPEVQNAVNRAASGGEIDGLLAGKAPAGYGYGDAMEVFSGTEAELENAFSSIIAALPSCSSKQIAFTCDDGTLYGKGRFSAVIYKDDDGYAHLTASVYNKNYSVSKSYFGGVWHPFEWFNPPMNPDVEYRTTERYHGKTVYKKLVSLGKVVAGNNTISGFVTDLGAVYFKSISVHLGPVATPLFSENSLSGYFSAYITTISNDLNFYVGGGFADYDAYAFAEYTKEVV